MLKLIFESGCIGSITMNPISRGLQLLDSLDCPYSLEASKDIFLSEKQGRILKRNPTRFLFFSRKCLQRKKIQKRALEVSPNRLPSRTITQTNSRNKPSPAKFYTCLDISASREASRLVSPSPCRRRALGGDGSLKVRDRPPISLPPDRSIDLVGSRPALSGFRGRFFPSRALDPLIFRLN
jgi:hypothetical protein